MKDTELKAARDRDLFLCYQKALLNHDFRNQWEAIEYVRSHPAPRYYISPKSCSLLLGRIFAGKPIDRLNSLARKRIRRLESSYRQLVQGEGSMKGLSRERICEIIVDMPAPEFYVTHRYATRIISREIIRHNQNQAGRLAV